VGLKGRRAPCGGSGVVTLRAAGGLAEEVDEKVLHAAFIPFGDITDIQIPLDYETGAWRGAGRRRALSRAVTAGCVRREAPRVRLRGVRAGGGEKGDAPRSGWWPGPQGLPGTGGGPPGPRSRFAHVGAAVRDLHGALRGVSAPLPAVLLTQSV